MTTYLQGHHDSVLRSHRWRTAENSAGYLLPHLQLGMRVLDVGCGPGTITRDLGALVGPDGEVLGVDSAAEVVAQAAKGCDLPQVSFAVGDALHLDVPDVRPLLLSIFSTRSRTCASLRIVVVSSERPARATNTRPGSLIRTSWGRRGGAAAARTRPLRRTARAWVAAVAEPRI